MVMNAHQKDPATIALYEAAADGGDDETRRRKRWRLMGDVAVFQGKLVLDGVRDIVLSPVSLVAAAIGLLADRQEPGRNFYRLMRWGRWSDKAIGLFNADGNPPAKGSHAAASPTGAQSQENAESDGSDAASVDRLVAEVEKVLLARYERSDLARRARAVIDQGFDSVHDQAGAGEGRLRQILSRIARRQEPEAKPPRRAEPPRRS